MTVIFILLLLGLLMGSFLNVVIFRIERGETFVRGRSKCLHCQKILSWYENIPLVSFFILRGKCRHCRTRLSWQYPLVELATALLFTASFITTQPSLTNQWELIAFLFLLGMLSFVVLITVYDLRYSLIPNAFLWGVNISTLGYLGAHWFSSPSFGPSFLPSMEMAFFGAFIAGAFFYLLVVISKETWMGWGDVWLGVWGGMLVGLPLVQVFITLSFTLGAIIGITLMATQKKTLKTEVPFAPYLLIGGLLIVGAMYQAPSLLQFLSPWLPVTIE